ncbi:EF-hand domain-containing protein d1 [Plakobranchus ocellatus]|uniref:EF-hand domain-containing protein d1 n=1 Tax=Plakobranchus ocellatus TaxID=259542 RepID=A0AAV4CQJ7_9GAST|nr:EF-hand domain-containing protein d1 [Plakobranchus ocellatus]
MIRQGYWLSILVVFLSVLQENKASYNEKACNKYTEGGTEYRGIPFYSNDFSVESEVTVNVNLTNLKGEETTFETIVQEKLWFSDRFRQLMVHRETATDSDFIFVDEYENHCVYKEDGGACIEAPGSCKQVADKLEFVSMKNGHVYIGSSANGLHWPPKENIKKRVYRGRSSVRSIATKLYATCTFDPRTNETWISQWHVLDTEKVTKAGEFLPPLLVMSEHQVVRGQKLFALGRIDYTNFKILSFRDIPNGLQIGDDQCKATTGNFLSRNPPAPSFSHSYISEVDKADTLTFESYAKQTSYYEYNYETKLLQSVYTFPVNNENEKEMVLEVYDYSTMHSFSYSLTNGNCKVDFEYLNQTSPNFPSPQEYWLLNSPKSSYLGVYMNRNIPCDTWLFEYPDGGDGFQKGDTVTLYLATYQWLDEYGMSTDRFFPVQMIVRTQDQVTFSSFNEFKNNPGYSIPGLAACYDQKDVVLGMVTLENTDYHTQISPHQIQFEYEFRSFIKNVTGIVSSLRIADILARPSLTTADGTDVIFTIYGRFAGINSSSHEAYRADPVTSKEAVEKINNQIDTGEITFILDSEPHSFYFKKGSFAILKNFDHFEYVDNSAETGNEYSSGAMAGMGIALLIVGLVISVGAVLAYKRSTERKRRFSSVGMEKVGEDTRILIK